MLKFQKSFAKINITLRITKLREDGYHGLCSLFLKIDRGEMLAISPSPDGDDHVSVVGAKVGGENIVAKALKFARESGADVPPLDVKINKTIPPGMGFGAGSGNAGAIFDFIGAKFPLPDVAKKVGADVPFFLCDCDAAIITGIGDNVERLEKLPVKVVISLPKINIPTAGAYRALDERFPNGKYPSSEASARSEIMDIKERLSAGERVGMLPNDFASPLIQRYDIYAQFFAEAETKDALAWGVTGSGAGMFALLRDGKGD